jgi:hypothetical protein
VWPKWGILEVFWKGNNAKGTRIAFFINFVTTQMLEFEAGVFCVVLDTVIVQMTRDLRDLKDVWDVEYT